MYHLTSYPVHRQRHRYEPTQPQSASSAWIHLKFLHSSCAALRVSETRRHQKTLLGSCRMFGEKEVLATCLFGVGAWYAHQERAPRRNNLLRCFPPTADRPRHTCLGHHRMRGGARRSLIMSATSPANRRHLKPLFKVSLFIIQGGSLPHAHPN